MLQTASFFLNLKLEMWHLQYRKYLDHKVLQVPKDLLMSNINLTDTIDNHQS